MKQRQQISVNAQKNSWSYRVTRQLLRTINGDCSKSAAEQYMMENTTQNTYSSEIYSFSKGDTRGRG